jgi:hypothetical protein
MMQYESQALAVASSQDWHSGRERSAGFRKLVVNLEDIRPAVVLVDKPVCTVTSQTAKTLG